MPSHRTRSLFPNQPGEFVLSDPAGNEIMRVPWMQPPPPVPVAQPGLVESAFKRGSLNVASDFSTTGGLLAEMVGADEYAQSFYEKAEEFSQRSSQYKATIGRIENIRGAGDLATYLVETLVEQAPLLASMLVPGGLVAKGAQIAGASVKGASIAGTTAAFLSNVGLQTGESGSIAREAGSSPVDIRVIGSGLGKAGLDFVPLLGLARRFGLLKNLPIAAGLERTIVGKLADGGFIRRAAGHSKAIVVREVPTEITQEIMNIALQRSFNNYGGELTEDEWSQLKNAAAGATAFGLLGIPAGIRRPAATDLPPRGTTPEGVDIQVDETREAINIPIEGGFREDGVSPLGGGTGADFTLQSELEVVGDTELSASFGVLIPPLAIDITDAKLPSLEAIPDEPQQRNAAAAALINEAATTDTGYYIGMDGIMVSGIPQDPMSESEGGDGPIAYGLNLTKEQLEVASSYPQYLDSDPSSPEGQLIATLHPGLQTLFEIRNDLLEDKDNYRTTDGLIKTAAQKKIDTVDKKIAKLQEALGIKPVVTETKVATPENVQEGEVIVETPPVELTASQKTRLERLAEKEEAEGLSQKEYEIYAELIGIASGEFGPVERQRQTQAQLTETAELATKVRDEETQTTPRYAQGTTNEPGTGVSPKTAKGYLTEFVKRFIYGPKVKLITRDHPQARDRRKKQGKEIRGWWDPKDAGVIYIVVDNNFSEKEILSVYFHETIAHYGLGTFLSMNEHLSILKDMLENPPPGFIFTEEQRASLDKGDITKLWLEAEEYIARVAESAIIDPKNGVVQMTWWKRLVARIRRFLRQHTKFNWSDNDIMFMLRDNAKLLTGQITTSNYAGQRILTHEIEEELAALNRALEGEITSGTRDQVKTRIKVLELNHNSGGFFPPNQEFFSAMGEANGRVANSAISQLGGVWGVKWAKYLFTPLQFAEQYKVPGTKEYLEFVQQWWARKRTLTDPAADITHEFLKFGRRDQQKLSKVILEMSIRSDEAGRRLTPEEQIEVFKENGIENDTALIKAWQAMDKSFKDMIVQLRTGLETNAIRQRGDKNSKDKLSREVAQSLQRQYTKAVAGTAADMKAMWQTLGVATMLRLTEIRGEMNQLENRNYFPRMRFGNWAITIRAKKDLTYKGKTYRGPRDGGRGDVVYFETFADTIGQANAADALAKDFGKNSYEIQRGKISESEFHFLGVMSPQLYEQLTDAIPTPKDDAEAGMSERMKEVLKEIYLKQAPGRSFLRHLTKRKGIDGYSEDVIRVYASYMMNVANHIARVEYHVDMSEQLTVIEESAATATPNANVEGIVRDYFQKHQDYIMNPKNDLARVRAVGFLWYLGANVKSAVVNLTQVPMVAYPYLASQYGDARSSIAIMKAMKLVTHSRVDGEVMPPELRTAIERGVREGFIDESRATELAGLAEQSVLQRVIPENRTGRAISNASYYGAFLFQKAERINREITFIAAYQLAKDNGVTSIDEAFKAGRKAVQTAMFEYNKWNRPEFMRGKKSVFFLFWQYMQGLSYMAFGGAGQGAAMRVWMMLLLAGGLQGLPFAENILDLLDFVGTQVKQRLGMKDPRVDLRNDLRALATEITDRPDMIMHGLSRYYGLGPLHLLGLLDVPVPNVDISGSISAGRILPGLDELGSPERDPSAKLGRMVADIAGPVIGIPYQFWRAALDNNPDTWKVWERTLPIAFKSMSSALRRSNIDIDIPGLGSPRGEESFRGGGSVVQFEPQDMEHRAELLAQFFGFATTRLNQRYEADFSINEMKRYWTIRRALIMENVAYARMTGDPEPIKDAWDALYRFNDTIPDGALRINGDQLMRSLKQRFRKASLRERGIPSELLYRRIAQAMRDLYPETEVEIESSSRR